MGLEVQGRDVVEDQAGWSQGCAFRARGREALAPRLLRVYRQAACQRAVGGRADPDLFEDPQAVELAGRLDDPGQHQIPEHHVTLSGLLEAERRVRPAQGVPQVAHLRRGDLQRPVRGSTRVHTKIELALALRQALSRGRFEGLEILLVVSRSKVLDLTRATPCRMHDLDSGCPRGSLHRAHVRHEPGPYDPRLVCKFRAPAAQNLRSAACVHPGAQIVAEVRSHAPAQIGTFRVATYPSSTEPVTVASCNE